MYFMPTPLPKGPPCVNIPKTRLLSPASPPPATLKKKLNSFVMPFPRSSSQLIFLHATSTSPHSGLIMGEHFVWPSWQIYQRRSHRPLEWETSKCLPAAITHFYGEPGALLHRFPCILFASTSNAGYHFCKKQRSLVLFHNFADRVAWR